jgi:putative acetyltransferase
VEVRPGDFEDPRVLALLRVHLDGMRANTPAEHIFALDLSGLRAPDISFWTVWDGAELLGCGALKELDATSGEVKSMRTDPARLRRGAGAYLLRHLLDTARDRGYRRVSLETGVGPSFEPALALYRRFGFTPGPAFGEYAASEFNQFLHLDLG